MLSDQGVDPTSLLRRSAGEVMAMQFNFHRLQLTVFTNSSYTQVKETNQAPLLPPDSPDDVGTSYTRDCLVDSDCTMQRRVSKNKVQMIHHQLTGPTIASRLKYLTFAPQDSLRSRQACVYRILRTIPLTCVT